MRIEGCNFYSQHWQWTVGERLSGAVYQVYGFRYLFELEAPIRGGLYREGAND